MFFDEPGISEIEPTESYFSLKSVVDTVCIDLDLPSSHYFNKFLHWGCIGLMDLNLDQSEDVREIYLPVSDVLTAQLPDDAIDIICIGKQYYQYIKVLCVNEKLDTSPRTVATFNPTNHPEPGWLPNGTEFANLTGYTFANYGGRALLNYGGGLPQTGHYKIVKREDGHKELLLDQGICLPNDTIFVSYIGLGVRPSGETVLEAYFYEYIRTYIHLQWAKFGKRADKSESEIIRLSRDLHHEYMKVRGRRNTLSPKELLMISRKSYRLTNKN